MRLDLALVDPETLGLRVPRDGSEEERQTVVSRRPAVCRVDDEDADLQALPLPVVMPFRRQGRQ